MTDTSTRPDTDSTNDTFDWNEPEKGGTGGQQAREWLTQLQSMIENLATQAAPVVRDVGAKAAELAAIAGEKAGPLAQRAAVFTDKAGHKLAERSRDLAEDLRRDAAAARAAQATGTGATDGTPETPDGAAEATAGEPMANTDEPHVTGLN